MEITLDVELVSRIASEEYKTAAVQLVQLCTVQAYEHSQRRHDERLASAVDAATLACRAGCHWCCYFTVDVRPVEVFRILDYIRREFSTQEQARVRAEVRSNSATLRQLDDNQRVQQNLRCPFLTAGRCTIYEARPQTCRNYHATCAAGCQQSFQEPANTAIDPDFAPLTYQVGGAHVDAFSQAMQDAGYDVHAYELNSALAAAWQEPELTRQRYEAKKRPFKEISGMEVESQFMDSP